MLTGDAGAAYVGRVYSCISMYDALGPREGGRKGGLADGDEMKEEFRVERGRGGGEEGASFFEFWFSRLVSIAGASRGQLIGVYVKPARLTAATVYLADK